MKKVVYKALNFTKENFKPGDWFIFNEDSCNISNKSWYDISFLSKELHSEGDDYYHQLAENCVSRNIQLKENLVINLNKLKTTIPDEEWHERKNKKVTRIRIINSDDDEMGLDFL